MLVIMVSMHMLFLDLRKSFGPDFPLFLRISFASSSLIINLGTIFFLNAQILQKGEGCFQGAEQGSLCCRAGPERFYSRCSSFAIVALFTLLIEYDLFLLLFSFHKSYLTNGDHGPPFNCSAKMSKQHNLYSLWNS